MYVDTESVLLVRMVLCMVLISRTLGEDMCLAGWEGWVRGSRMVERLSSCESTKYRRILEMGPGAECVTS